MFTPEHVDAVTVANMMNIAYRNAQSFGSQFSDAVLQKYADQSDPLRYPDVDWYSLIQKKYATSTNADFSVSGGSDKVRYYLSVGYVHEGSILKEVHEGTNCGSNKITYRANLDWDITKTTIFAFKVGGVCNMFKELNQTNTSDFFTTMYFAPTITYPAYYPAWALEKFIQVSGKTV